MKQILLSLIAFIIVIGGSTYLEIHAVHRSQGEVKSVHITNSIISPIPLPTRPGLPLKLSIPSLRISASVESVGLDKKGYMDVPVHALNAGWYNLGVRPGEKGSAVMAGHLDTVTGAPAVFWDLKKLKTGDEIQVSDESGINYTFRVIEIASYPYNNFPLQKVFNTTDKPRLNLITCAGTWDKKKNNYSNRTVIYAEIFDK